MVAVVPGVNKGTHVVWNHMLGQKGSPFLQFYILWSHCAYLAWSFSADYDGKESGLNHEPSGYLGQGGGR